MATKLQGVPEKEWRCNSETPLDIGAEIVADIDPNTLVQELVRQTICSIRRQRDEEAVAFYDEPTRENKSHFRRSCVVVSIASCKVFNQFFNGRCGYRAMYWHSEELGSDFNTHVVRTVFEALKKHCENAKSPLFSGLDNQSLLHEHAKIWPFFEKKFLAKGELVVPRWRSGAAGRCIFNPAYSVFVVKGAFLDDAGKEGPFKCCRSKELHESGFT